MKICLKANEPLCYPREQPTANTSDERQQIDSRMAHAIYKIAIWARCIPLHLSLWFQMDYCKGPSKKTLARMRSADASMVMI